MKPSAATLANLCTVFNRNIGMLTNCASPTFQNVRLSVFSGAPSLEVVPGVRLQADQMLKGNNSLFVGYVDEDDCEQAQRPY